MIADWVQLWWSSVYPALGPALVAVGSLTLAAGTVRWLVQRRAQRDR